MASSDFLGKGKSVPLLDTVKERAHSISLEPVIEEFPLTRSSSIEGKKNDETKFRKTKQSKSSRQWPRDNQKRKNSPRIAAKSHTEKKRDEKNSKASKKSEIASTQLMEAQSSKNSINNPSLQRDDDDDDDKEHNLRECAAELLTPRVSSGEKRRLIIRSALKRSQEYEKQDRIKAFQKIVQQMEHIRQEMESGIEQMHLRIYQMKNCEKFLNTTINTIANNTISNSLPGSQNSLSPTARPPRGCTPSPTKSCPSSTKIHSPTDQWESIVMSLLERDCCYESSKSGVGGLVDGCHESRPPSSSRGSLSPSPVLTPSGLDSLTRQGSLDQSQRVRSSLTPTPRPSSSTGPLLPVGMMTFQDKLSPLFDGVSNKAGYQGPPLPGISAFQLSCYDASSSDESMKDDDQDQHQPYLVEDGLGEKRCSSCSLDYTSSHVQVSSRNGLKTNVILNLKGQHKWQKQQRVHEKEKIKDVKSQTQLKEDKEHAIDRLIGMLCAKRGDRATPKRVNQQDEKVIRSKTLSTPTTTLRSKWLDKAKAIKRGCERSIPLFSLRRNRQQVKTEGKGKFTDKYPVDDKHDDILELLQKFCLVSKSSAITLDSTLTIARLQPESGRRGCVFSADGFSYGIGCYSLTCTELKGPCFIGILAKEDILSTTVNEESSICDHDTFHGWKNAGDILTEERHLLERKRSFKSSPSAIEDSTCTEAIFQVMVDIGSGSIHLRVRQKEENSEEISCLQISEFSEYELCFVPSNMEWYLGIEWFGPGQFQLNSTEA